MDRIRRNMDFLRRLYTTGAERPAWSFMPRRPDLTRDRDYTLGVTPPAEAAQERLAIWREHRTLLETVDSDTVPLASLNTGTQLFAQAFGCSFHLFDNDPPCALPLAADAREASQLRAPRVEDCPNLMRVFELAEALERELGPEIPLAAPDFQSGFDIACQIWDKSDLLCAMIDDPEAVRHLAGEASVLIRDFFIKLRSEFPQLSPCHCPGSWTPPEAGIWVSNDECGAVSNEMFEEFCLPELIGLSQCFGGLGMHCCADAEHQFASFKKIPNFHGFNRVAARQGYRPLCDNWRDGASPVFTLAWVDLPAIRELLACAAPENRWHFVFLGLSVEEARILRDEIDALPADILPDGSL